MADANHRMQPTPGFRWPPPLPLRHHEESKKGRLYVGSRLLGSLFTTPFCLSAQHSTARPCSTSLGERIAVVLPRTLAWDAHTHAHRCTHTAAQRGAFQPATAALIKPLRDKAELRKIWPWKKAQSCSQHFDGSLLKWLLKDTVPCFLSLPHLAL